MIKLFVLCFLVLCLSGCDGEQFDFLVDCERINAETVRCDIGGMGYLADFPVKEDRLKMKAKVAWSEGNTNAFLYIIYGGEIERKTISPEDAKTLIANAKRGYRIQPAPPAPTGLSVRQMEENLEKIRGWKKGIEEILEESNPPEEPQQKPQPVRDWRD